MGWNIDLPAAEWFTPDSPSHKLEALINEVMATPDVAIDTETTGLNVVKDIPLYWSLSWGERRIAMPAVLMHKFKPAFDDPNKNWILANAKFDRHMQAQIGIDVAGKLVDIQVMHALIYEEQPHGLKYIAKSILDWGWRDFFDTFEPLKILEDIKENPDDDDDDVLRMSLEQEAAHLKKKARKKAPKYRKEAIGEMLQRFERDNLEALVEYASMDAYGTMKGFLKLKEQLQAEATWSLYPDKFPNMWEVFWKTEVPFTKVLWKCERNGLLIDTDYIQKIRGPVEDGIARLEKSIAKEAGRVMNLNSRDELAAFFFEERGHKATKLTKGGKTGVKKKALDAAVLEDLSIVDPVAKMLLELRDLTKMHGTYIVGLSKHLDKWNRIHCRLNQDVARTGRLSSSNPNLQNIPKPDTDKFKIRGAFCAPEGYVLIVLDYDQLEMRLLAAAAMEPDMIALFKSGKDIHMGNAEFVLGPIYQRKYGRALVYDDMAQAKKTKKKDPAALTDWDNKCLFARDAIKAVCYGLNYGMKSKKLAANLGVSIDEAQEVIDAYMARYPTVANFYASSIATCKQTNKAYTLIGRRRFLPEINGHNTYERWQAERQATNTVIQGTAADAARLAMISCDEAVLDYHYGADMLLQVHDELIFQCPAETAQAAHGEIKEYMEHPFPTDLEVELTCGGGIGPNWNDAK
jgi:DNA polymerase I-like protein with 3'-5' exonuclease and polymerase domains